MRPPSGCQSSRALSPVPNVRRRQPQASGDAGAVPSGPATWPGPTPGPRPAGEGNGQSARPPRRVRRAPRRRPATRPSRGGPGRPARRRRGRQRSERSQGIVSTPAPRWPRFRASARRRRRRAPFAQLRLQGRQLVAQLAVAGCQGTNETGQGLRVQAGRGGVLVRGEAGQRHVAGGNL